MSELDAIANQLRETLTSLGKAIQQDAAPLDELARQVAALEDQIQAQAAQYADRDVSALKEEWETRRAEQQHVERALTAARALGAAQIKAQTKKAESELADLKELKLDKARESVAKWGQQLEQKHDVTRQVEAQQQTHQETLERLESEAKELARREKDAKAKIKEWEARQRLRDLRQSCRQTAQEIRARQTALEQKLSKP